jgi:putative colanic acid biosynthesis acetyltransferase WcaF
MKGITDLSTYNNDWYKPGASGLKRMLWYFTNIIFFKSGLFPINGLKTFLLRSFGAKIGKGLILKPVVNIKYPWKLRIGDHCWIGENVWIDNLAFVSLGDHVCLSQNAMLLTGNHDYKKSTFDLMIGEIVLENGVWIGAHAIVSPGVNCFSHSVLAVNSVATKDLDAYGIYQGNPAQKIKERDIEV